ncbi:PKD domain-containing protein [Rhodocytophaga rosea]|uniref:PKD domain-containing protein n=1 Tax=Rhodocytophaga rosea TaxID=2704465 RepID=A0A6C0GQ17_9BACT|nr:PQQ-dependent sugar dehydrogenase [Rhodocytophaga rosea]QHT69713.1 PKD domain-containing protein [Rhodocytophaga rosea]
MHFFQSRGKENLLQLIAKKAQGYSLALWMSLCIAFFLIPLQKTNAQAPPAGFTTQTVVSGLNQAVGLTFSKDGNYMFVWEKGGKAWVVRNGVKTLLIDISEEVGNWGDLGMLGFALHPQFDVNGYFYLLYVVDRHHLLYYGTQYYSPTTNVYFNATIGRLTRYTATKNGTGDYVVNTASRKILLGESISTGIPNLSTLHGAGSLVFGTDGTLLISAGDGGHAATDSDVGNAAYATTALNNGIIPPQQNVGAYRAQQLESLNGKILRVDPETGNGVPSNPFYNASAPRSARSRVWALGFRNPFRISLMPGSGSTNPADGKPGILYVGDVGMNRWEELNIVTDAGQNFGWPHFEGMTLNEGVNGDLSFSDKNVENPYAPNPLYGVNGCTQRYFKFGDLLKQAQIDHSPAFPNPCNPAQSVPASINTFMHTRPTIDWRHVSGPSRAGIYTADGQASVVNIGAVNSPIAGPQFGGSSSVAGAFYSRDDFPAEYINSYFHGDYASGWIKNMVLDEHNKPVAVKNFINTGAIVVCMATHPNLEGLYYINYQTEVRKVYYSVNLPPLVEASVNKTFGTGPLVVQFTGSNSSDPEGSALTYEWNFGDGTALSTLANPAHTYNAPAGVPTRYNVTLKVKDASGATTTNTLLFVSVNNTPPIVNITSPAEGTKYSLASETDYILKATVTDAQHSGTGLTYQWQTTLHHENHIHPGPIVTQIQPTTTISPEGCNGETFFYTITLTVIDAAGLSGTDEIILLPDCNPTPVIVNNITNLAATALDAQVRVNWTNPASLDQIMIVAKAGTGITASPVGDGSAYVASTNFSNGGTSFDGGKVVYKGTASPQTITGLTNNTLYYFKVFTRSGTNWSDGIQTSSTPVAPTVTVSNVTNLAATALDTQVRLNWTNPANLDQIMIVAKAGASITATPTGDGSAYIASTNFTNGGSSFDGGKVVYKGTASPQTITGLTNNTLYYFKVFTRIGTTWSTGIQTSATPFVQSVTVSNVTNLATTALDAQVRVNWTNPASLDQIMIVAKAGTGITASPVGDGSAYVASTNFSNGGTSFDGGKVVYKGTASPQTITGLTNNTLYYFKVFTRIGTTWSTGIQTSATPFVSTTTLPAPWKNADVGAVGLAGSAGYSNGTFTVKGAGYDFWTAPDNFHFVYQPISGNTTVIARIASIQNTDPNAKAGIMIRENLTANASFAATVVHPSGRLLMSRQGTGTPKYVYKTGSAPVWVKLVRSGNTFTSSYSTTGTTWTTIGTVTITMGTTVYVGMAVTSHKTTVLNTSTFTNVSVTGQPAATARKDYAPENVEQKLSVTIHPNPNSGDKIMVDIAGFIPREKAGVSLQNVSGQIVDTSNGTADEEGNLHLTLTPPIPLRAGVYIIQIRSATSVIHEKVVVQ